MFANRFGLSEACSMGHRPWTGLVSLISSLTKRSLTGSHSVSKGGAEDPNPRVPPVSGPSF
jgi:hypothetical protein